MTMYSAALKWSVSEQNDWQDGDYGIAVATPGRSALPAPVYPIDEKDVAHKFQQLARQWKEETIHVSSFVDMVTHPAYLAIIGMGEKALPFLFDELRRDPDHWFAALSAITQQNDVIAPAAAGSLDEMTDAWLRWARQHGH